MLCYAMLCYAMLYCTVLYYALPCSAPALLWLDLHLWHSLPLLLTYPDSTLLLMSHLPSLLLSLHRFLHDWTSSLFYPILFAFLSASLPFYFILVPHLPPLLSSFLIVHSLPPSLSSSWSISLIPYSHHPPLTISCYRYCTVGTGDDDAESLKDFDTASPLAGLGYGLPISRYVRTCVHAWFFSSFYSNQPLHVSCTFKYLNFSSMLFFDFDTLFWFLIRVPIIGSVCRLNAVHRT